MSTKSKPKEEEFFVETIGTYTNGVFRKALAEIGGNHEDVSERVLKINGKSKTGLYVPRSIIENAESSKDQILGGPMKYNIFQKSKDGSFLNLPRESFKKKKGDSKAQNENARLNKQLKDMAAKNAKK